MSSYCTSMASVPHAFVPPAGFAAPGSHPSRSASSTYLARVRAGVRARARARARDRVRVRARVRARAGARLSQP